MISPFSQPGGVWICAHGPRFIWDLGKGPKRLARHNIALKYEIEARYASSNISVGQMAPASNTKENLSSFSVFVSRYSLLLGHSANLVLIFEGIALNHVLTSFLYFSRLPLSYFTLHSLPLALDRITFCAGISSSWEPLVKLADRWYWLNCSIREVISVSNKRPLSLS